VTNRSLKTFTALSVVVPLFWVLGGCKSTSANEYLAPRVVGRVFDSQTREPLAGVEVKRLSPGVETRSTLPRKGGEMLLQRVSIYTGKDGRFVIDSERDLGFLFKMNWYSFDVSFECTGYEGLLTNYTLVNATNLPSGEPVVDTGNIFLHRRTNGGTTGTPEPIK